MTTLTTFSLFPQLPKELRLQIWKEAITPRTLKLQPQISPLDFRKTHRFLYLVGGLDSLRHFTLDDLNRPEEPYYTVQLMPYKFSCPPLLQVCKESRDIALESGYQVWKMYDQNGRTRNVIWNPSQDVLVFQNQGGRVWSPMDVFVQQYPEEARQARRVGAMSSVWKLDLNLRGAVEVVGPLLRMAAIQEFVVLVDEVYERELVEQVKLWESSPGWRGRYGWQMPADVRECIFTSYQAWDGVDKELSKELSVWNVPKVRVVWNEEGLFGDEELDLKLRTWPCEALGMPSMANSTKSGRLHGIIKKIARLGMLSRS